MQTVVKDRMRLNTKKLFPPLKCRATERNVERETHGEKFFSV